MNISPAVKIKLLLWFTTATITPLHLHLIQIESMTNFSPSIRFFVRNSTISR